MEPNGRELLQELLLMGLEEEAGEDAEEKRREIENMDEEALLEKLVQEERARKEAAEKEEIPYTPESFQKWAEERWQGEDDLLKNILQEWPKRAEYVETCTKEILSKISPEDRMNVSIDLIWLPEDMALRRKQREDADRWRQEGLLEDEVDRRQEWQRKGEEIELSVIRRRIRLVREKYGFPPEKKGPHTPIKIIGYKGTGEKDGD